MPPLSLNSGAYTAQGLIASAQRCLNLYPESVPEETSSPVQMTHLLGPGLTPLFQLPDQGEVRCLYTASDQSLYAVCKTSVYWISFPAGLSPQANLIGQLASSTNLVRMADNGQNILLADGTAFGYTINMATHVMSAVNAANNSGSNGFFYTGADWVDQTDTFLIGNMVGNNRWFASTSLGLGFDSLSNAAKTGSPDTILATVVLQRNVWLIGTLATELAYDAGGTNFPFAALEGPYVNHGAVGKYCMVRIGDGVGWIAQGKDGTAIALLGTGYQATAITTFAISNEWQGYPTLTDAVAFSFELAGHGFLGWRFPSADKTWLFDTTTKQWHERSTADASGNEHQWRVNCSTFANGMVLAGDFSNGWVYQIDPNNGTDNGTPIKRLRQFPHQINALKRITDWVFTLDMLTGQAQSASTIGPFQLAYDQGDEDLDGLLVVEPSGGSQPLYLDPAYSEALLSALPVVNLRYSSDRGSSWGPYIQRQLGAQGQRRRLIQWRRLGQGRDRVYEVSWTSPQMSALNGAWMTRLGAGS